jgi:hypothetical protein
MYMNLLEWQQEGRELSSRSTPRNWTTDLSKSRGGADSHQSSLRESTETRTLTINLNPNIIELNLDVITESVLLL